MSKRARSENGTGWYTSVTRFVDDYKMRGQDPSTTYGPYFYHTREAAYAKLVELLRCELTGLLDKEEDENGDYIEDVDMKAIPADRIYAIACGRVVEYSDIACGEYVNQRFTFHLGEITYEEEKGDADAK